MAHHTELMRACFDAVGARSIAEVGAYAGDLTRILLGWASVADASVLAIDPAPQPSLVALSEEHPRLDLVRDTSLKALASIALPDVLIIDGDHNYYTVLEELRLIAERTAEAPFPLLLFHDVCWPHSRRDDYFEPAQIPAECRHAIVGESAGIFPGDPGVRPDGLPYPRSAAREGGPRNGVLTAIEDFVTELGRDLRVAVVPVFFGFGAVWDPGAEWAQSIGAVLETYDRNPLLERLEANRIEHLAEEHALRVALWRMQERQARQEAVLRRLLESRAFTVAERLSRLRARAGVATWQSIVSRKEVRRALEP